MGADVDAASREIRMMRTLRELLTVGTILPALVVSGTGPSGSA